MANEPKFDIEDMLAEAEKNAPTLPRAKAMPGPSTATVMSSPPPQLAVAAKKPSPPIELEKRFGALRLVGWLYLISGVLCIAGLMFSLFALEAKGGLADNQRITLSVYFGAAAIGAFAISALINLMLAIEENTRATRMLLERMRKP
jgi:hypothetical protein